MWCSSMHLCTEMELKCESGYSVHKNPTAFRVCAGLLGRFYFWDGPIHPYIVVSLEIG